MRQSLSDLVSAANSVILGKSQQICLALCCLLARGHLLIEDLPGVGKTTLAHTLARLLGLHYQRVQFTADLLPGDVLGVSIFDQERHSFRFQPGPVFSQLLLADEINRATPKAQSALLEAMEERQVTVDGETRQLPEPFFVIATQNPSYQIGTYPLPESQLDRFLMRLHIGYPDRAAELELLRGKERRVLIESLPVCVYPNELIEMQAEVGEVFAAEALLDYIYALLSYSRESREFEYGLSPRAGLALLNAAKAWAYLDGRDAALPEDVQMVLPAVAGHRLRSIVAGLTDAAGVAQPLVDNVAIP